MSEKESASTPQDSQLFGGDETSLAVRVYCQMMDKLVQRDSPRHERLHADAIELLRRLDPQDAIEQMMVEQMLWMHGRLAYLNYYAALQTRNKPMQVLHTAADRLANTLRRHMVAFADYRNPGRKRFTAVRQANIAQQQIVSNNSPARQMESHDSEISRSITEASTTILSTLK
jgi:hypothetical protein